MDADQKFLQFLRKRVRGEDDAGYLSLPEEDLNNTPLWGEPAWPAGWKHLITCPDMAIYLGAKTIDHTGYCESCIETAYRADFTVTCPHASEPAMWWEYAYDIDGAFAQMEWDY